MISSLFILVACLSPHVVEGTARGGIDSSESTGFATQTRVPVSVSVITPPPSLGELRRRQGLYTSDFLMAADNTCGYYGGNSDQSLTCKATEKCAFAPGKTSFVACCGGGGCSNGLTGCVDSATYVSGSYSAYYQAQSMILKCTNAANPYCGTLTFFSGIRDYKCFAQNTATEWTMWTTYIDQTNAIALSTISIGMITMAAATPSNSISQTSSTTSLSTTSLSTTSMSTSPSTMPTIDPSGGSSSTPTGAVIGGAVGGSAAVVLLGLLAWYLLWRRGGTKEQHTQDMAEPAASTYYPSPMQEQYYTGQGQQHYTGQSQQHYTGQSQQHKTEVPQSPQGHLYSSQPMDATAASPQEMPITVERRGPVEMQ